MPLKLKGVTSLYIPRRENKKMFFQFCTKGVKKTLEFPLFNLRGLGGKVPQILCSTVFILSIMGLFPGCASKNYPYMKDWDLKQGAHKKMMDRQRQGLPMEEEPKKEPDMTAEAYENLGNQYLQQGNMDEAFVQYNKALQLNPQGSRVRYKVGLLFLRRGLPDEALKEFQEILKKDEGYALAHEGMGQAFMQMGKYDEAEKNFHKALQLNPELWLSHNFLGMIYDRKLRFEDAIAHYEVAITIKPDQDIVLNNLGVSYYLKGEYEKSVEILLKALGAGSNLKNPKIYNNLGLVLGKLNRYEEALEAFKKAGDSAAAYNNLGYVYFLQGRYKEAATAFEKALEIKPSFYHRANENLKKAKEALRNEDFIPSWAVHIEAWKDKDKADERAEILRKKGYEVIVTEVEIPQKGSLYRVSIGGFKDKQAAYRKKEEIKKDFPDAWVAGVND